MAENMDQDNGAQNPEVTILPKESPHTLLSQALFWLKFYSDNNTDLSPIENAQDILTRLLVLFPENTSEKNDEIAFLNKDFEVCAITRLDLIKAVFPKPIVLMLSDEDMHEIASGMGDTYNNNGYWEDLDLAVNRTIREKSEEM